MCGIAGLYALDGKAVSHDAVRRMGEAIRHRGPDQEGFHFDGQVGLAIERLKVIDLVSGAQPISNETRDVTVVFNGEIYNYRELRQDLQARGHTLATNSDTETIVHLYEEHGADFVHRLNGMFSIALWDKKRKRLLLVRDPAGIKPLFYSTHGGLLRFGSEIKAILSDERFPREVDADALSRYLSFYYSTAPATLFKHVRRLPAGHRLIAEGDQVVVEPYWDLSFDPDPKPTAAEWQGRFRDTLQSSVRRHLQSDVPVGIYLSGGLDSTSIVAAAAKEHSRLKTYSVGFAEKSYSELEQAKLVAGHYKTDHHEYVLDSNLVADLLPQVIRQIDEPHGDWSHLPNYFLSKEARKSVTVVLVGTGGDELFGGYPTYVAAQAAMLYRKLPEAVRTGMIRPLVEALPTSNARMSWDFIAKSFVRGADAPFEQAHQRFKEIFSAEDRRLLLGGPLAAADGDGYRVFAQYNDHFARMNGLDRLMYLDFKVFMPDCSLAVNDLTTSAHSLEGRVPFLDKEMIALSSRLPTAYKVSGTTTKRLMRDAMARELPPEVLKMPKKGFLIPGSSWISGPLKPMILDVAGRAEKHLGGLFHFDFVWRMLREHFDGKRDHTRRISCLISLFLWDELYRPAWPARLEA
jgi:asparagine synthase (glutamine-hydrolysing)